MMQRTILGNAEAAKLLGVTESALRQMRYKHTIPYYKNRTGARVYYLQNELEDWMLATRVATAAEVEEQATKELL
jgi:hypothetical protein